jgi:CheY-like chemotaxis protein
MSINPALQNPVRSIVLIDDSEIDNFLHKQVLKKIMPVGEVIAFSTGRDALQYLQNHTPDMIFLDIHMPLMNGFEFLDEYEKMEEDRELPHIIMISSSVDPEDLFRAKMNQNVQRYLNKPIMPDTLKSIFTE